MPYEQGLSYSKDLIKRTKIEIPKKLILPFTGTAAVKLYDAMVKIRIILWGSGGKGCRVRMYC
ncbi:hypothetical protein [Clostridium kluyveri]|uniref:Uncharacterized protein n=1 Tax=Clostridium kluyveri TaxID=1534 RepID=A0A1L5FCY5_CLOKL|nr:hypothetical protein [Clostridium kluyveri]APM40879.1 hypothetical protein BS101_20290 [Clostridium kluyveri]UZQ48976.1 hypothetical protein OP486_13415 [Clostridium kluyveri]